MFIPFMTISGPEAGGDEIFAEFKALCVRAPKEGDMVLVSVRSGDSEEVSR